ETECAGDLDEVDVCREALRAREQLLGVRDAGELEARAELRLQLVGFHGVAAGTLRERDRAALRAAVGRDHRDVRELARTITLAQGDVLRQRPNLLAVGTEVRLREVEE